MWAKGSMKAVCKRGHIQTGRLTHRCIECTREYAREQFRDHTEKCLKRIRECQLKKDYGITVDQYDSMFQSQKGRCTLCDKHQSELKKRLGVDHDHVTGKVRSLLCDRCNLLLGLAHDDTTFLEKTISYLKENN